MSRPPIFHTTRPPATAVLAATGLVLCSACSWMRPALGAEQASDLVTSTGMVAMTAVRATVLSIPSQPVTTLRLGGAMLIHRPHASFQGNTPLARRYRTPIPEAPGTPEFEAVLDRKHLPRAEPGTLTWLVDGPAFFSELNRQIDGARESTTPWRRTLPARAGSCRRRTWAGSWRMARRSAPAASSTPGSPAITPSCSFLTSAPPSSAA
ncbi:MAG: hypothetical protein MUF04_11485 [Akkermansiaceae bacterium]|nr:hypothetical protein [Akkermansiaceae bacterium]